MPGADHQPQRGGGGAVPNTWKKERKGCFRIKRKRKGGKKGRHQFLLLMVLEETTVVSREKGGESPPPITMTGVEGGKKVATFLTKRESRFYATFRGRGRGGEEKEGLASREKKEKNLTST